MQEIKLQYALIDRNLSRIRKVTGRGVVCWLRFGFGGGNRCEKAESFLKRKIEYIETEQALKILRSTNHLIQMPTRISAQRQRQLERAYEVRNLSGFEGDSYMRDKFKQIIADYKINLVIELGSYLGGTTRQLAKMVENGITVEINQTHYLKAQDNLRGFNNVATVNEDSVQILPSILEAEKDKNILIFSDDHWYDNNPLLKDLEIIAKSGLKPCLAIHDFKVPNRPDLGFDTYGDIIYEWDWIKESVEKIYGVDGYVKEYNDKATGAKRGIIYIYPK